MNINNILRTLLSNRLGRSADKLELRRTLQKVGVTLPGLNLDEEQAITNLWSRIGGGILNLDYWKFYKGLNDGVVDPYFVPDNIYWSRIIRALNPVSLTRTYINKNLYPIIFNGVNQPEVLVNSVNGIVYDKEMTVIDSDKAIELLYESERGFIIKPTVATSGGSGVQKISKGISMDKIKRILSGYGNNYICQELVQQSVYTSAFNRESLNTFRVNTINLNGKTTCECLMMRHGLRGSHVDNFAAGGVVCGMNTDGTFNGCNYNAKLELLSSLQDGKPYENLVIPNIKRVLDAAIDTHQKYMPHIGHAAWDFAIDSDENPVMIEVNLMLPGIIFEQLTSGHSIFGSRTEEVIEYATQRNKHLSWTEFVGGWG